MVTTDNPPVDFNTTFNEDVAANLQSVVDADTECFSDYTLVFTTE